MTTQTKHTPGQWCIGYHAEYNHIVFAGGVPLATTEPNCSNETQLANARLIAAAPELLAALGRMLVGATNQSTPDCEWYEGILDDAIDEARAAISKARGEA